MVIGRTRDPPVSFVLGGTTLQCVSSLCYLGAWIDSRLTWGTHIRFVTHKAMDRLRSIRHGLGTMWGLHPTIFRRMVDAVIIPTLFYACPVWCSAVCHASCLTPLDRVLRQCSIAIMGLFHTIALDSTLVLAGILSAEFQIQRRKVEFYLRQLVHRRDILSLTRPSLRLNRVVAPIDILKLELRHLDNVRLGLSSSLSHVEPRH